MNKGNCLFHSKFFRIFEKMHTYTLSTQFNQCIYLCFSFFKLFYMHEVLVIFI